MKNSLPVILIPATLLPAAAGAESAKIAVTIERGRDLGQGFGSLVEATSDDVVYSTCDRLAATTLTGSLAEQLGRVKGIENVKWGDGIYGRFGGASINRNINSQ